MKKEIRAGAPGGQKFAPLSLIQRTLRAQLHGGRLGSNRPLRALAKGVRYFVPKTTPFEVHIGFVGPQYVSARSGDGLAEGYRFDKNTGRGEQGWDKSTIVGSTWRRLAKQHQEGFATDVNAPFFKKGGVSISQYLRQIGSQVDYKTFGKKKAKRRNVFFLRKGTESLKTPARPIVEPFNRAHRAEALRKIRRDFFAKMRGERI